jgi:predicted kinase
MNNDNLTIILMRGACGSGKSTLISRLEKEYNKKAYICSADDYHYFGKEQILENYKFDLNNLHIAHKQCKEKFTEGLNNNEPLIVIDNTNIKERDYKFYYLTGREHLYNVIFHTILPGTVEQHFKSNVHNVPRAAIEQMIANLKPVPAEIKGEKTKEIFYDFNELRKNK